MSINISKNVLPASCGGWARSSAGLRGRAGAAPRGRAVATRGLAAEELLHLIGCGLGGDQEVFQVVSLELAQNKVCHRHLSRRTTDAKLQAHKIPGLELVGDGT